VSWMTRPLPPAGADREGRGVEAQRPRRSGYGTWWKRDVPAMLDVALR
jgi:hypothetical protein